MGTCEIEEEERVYIQQYYWFDLSPTSNIIGRECPPGMMLFVGNLSHKQYYWLK